MKKIFLNVILTFSIFLFCPSVEATTLEYTATHANGNRVDLALGDSNRNTNVQLTQGGYISFDMDILAKNLYLYWDVFPVDGWVLSDAQTGTILTTSDSGFLHELVPINDTHSGQLRLTANSSAILTDTWLFDDHLADFVQHWSSPYEQADILVMSTHADDELLYLGATLATYAGDPDVAVQVAYMVNHNGEPYRNHELLNGLYTLGVRHYPIIPDFADMYSDSLDHARTIYSEDEIIAYQTKLLDRFAPQVVIGHDLKGEYGHGAHMLNAYALTQTVPKSDVKRLYLHLYEDNEILMDVDAPLAHAQNKTAYELCVEGFAKHVSQQTYFKVKKDGPYDMRKFGIYYQTVPPVQGDDSVMSGLTSYSQQQRMAEEKAIIATKEKERLVAMEAKKIAKQELSEKELLFPEATNDHFFAFVGEFDNLWVFWAMGFGVILLIVITILMIKKKR